MPNVKAPSIPKRTVQGIPSVDLTADVRGTNPLGGLAEGLQRTLPTLEERAADMKRKADEANVLAAHNALIKWQRQNIYATKDENPEAALNLEGEGAAGIGPKFQTSHKEYADQLAQGLTSEDQQSAFAKIFKAEDEQVFRDLNSHERKQFEVTSANRYKESIDDLVNKAHQAYDPERGFNPALFRDTLQTGFGVINQRADSYKVPQEVRKAEQKAFASRAFTGLITGMMESNPGEAVRIYNENKGYLDFTQPGVKDLEASIRAVGVKAQAQALVKSMVKRGLSPDAQYAEILNEERSDKPKYSPHVTEYAKALVTKTRSEQHALKEAAADDVFQRGRNYVNLNYKTWTKETSTHYAQLVRMGSDKASYLDDYARTLRRQNSADKAEKAFQASVDKQYLAAVKRGIVLEDPEAMDEAKHDDPTFQTSKTKRRDGVIALPSDTAVAQGKLFLAVAQKKADAASRPSRVSLRDQAWSLAMSNDLLPDSEARKMFVARVLYAWDQERTNKGAVPDAKWTSDLLSRMSLQVRTDPNAWLFTGDMGYDEAYVTGQLGNAVELPAEDQGNPSKKPGFIPPQVGESSPAKPGYVIVRKGAQKAQVKLGEVEEWLKKNPDWSR